MTTHHQLKPASELAKKNSVRFPNESGEYRRARDLLLAEEVELRRDHHRSLCVDVADLGANPHRCQSL